MANVERLKAVKQAILDHTDKFMYQSWCSKHKIGPWILNDFNNIVDPDCGTCGCVAGFTLGIFGSELIPNINSNHDDIGDVASMILDLTAEEENYLFLCEELEGVEYDGQESIDLATATEEDAIKRIDYLIAKYST